MAGLNFFICGTSDHMIETPHYANIQDKITSVHSTRRPVLNIFTLHIEKALRLL